MKLGGKSAENTTNAHLIGVEGVDNQGKKLIDLSLQTQTPQQSQSKVLNLEGVVSTPPVSKAKGASGLIKAEFLAVHTGVVLNRLAVHTGQQSGHKRVERKWQPSVRSTRFNENGVAADPRFQN